MHDPELEVTPGSDATLSCSATGNVAEVDRIQWERENGELPPGINWASFSVKHLVMLYVITYAVKKVIIYCA